MKATFDTRPLDQSSRQPGFIRGYRLLRVGDGDHRTLAFWSAAPPGEDHHDVASDLAGPAADRPGAVVAVGYFDGPMSPARVAAGRFGFEARITPALAAVPGLVRSVVLWQPVTAAMCIVTVTVDLPALDDVGRAVNGTALLPGEDPALLTGFDRHEVHHLIETAPVARGANLQGVNP